jgi:hypothetical protein
LDTLRGRDSAAYHPPMKRIAVPHPANPDTHVRRLKWLKQEYARLLSAPRSSLLQLAFISREIDFTESKLALALDKAEDWARLKREEADFLAQTNPALKVINGGKP